MWRSVPLLLAAALIGGCADPTGSVELAWVFVDRDGDPIYPGGVFSLEDERDTCDLAGQIGQQSTRYDLRVQLEICDPDCAAGCDADECLVAEPRRFGCNTARGNEPQVPASDTPYRFTVRPVISIAGFDTECRDALPTCLAVPAPRERTVQGGLVVDLQVYEILVDIDRTATEAQERDLDLEDCGCA